MKIALQIPWGKESIPTQVGYNPAETNFQTDTVTLGSAITQFGQIALYVGGALMFFWAVWGVFDYIRAEGNKEALAKARKRIQWAIAGFVILLLAFFLSDFTQQILSPLTPTLTEIKIQ
jgi:NADH:ubiquinone oxidoreductase subunit 6 (subunit J)